MSALVQVFHGLFEVALYVLLIGLAAGVVVGFMTATASVGVRIVEAIRSLFRTKIK